MGETERRPACASEDWVSQLPKLIDAACEDWHLSLDDERMAAGAWGVVAWCHTESGLEAALKLCANEERLSAETNAMLAWVGRQRSACSLTDLVRCFWNAPVREDRRGWRPRG